MPKALVTGGAGFIGRHLVGRLIEGGWDVCILDLAPFIDAPDGIECVAASVLDEDAVRAALTGADAVFHLAAKADLWAPNKNVYEAINVEGTRAMLTAARAAGVQRFIHVGSETARHSAGAAARNGRVPAVNELAGPYVRSKRVAEDLVLWAAAEGFPALIISPTVPIGPGDVNLTPPTRMLLDFLEGRTPAYLDAELNFVDVRDVARALAGAADRGDVGGRYTIAGENMHLSGLLHLIEELTGAPMPKRRIPWRLAWCAAVAGEALARVTGRPPRASLEGVRLARAPFIADGGPAAQTFDFTPTPVATALADTLLWLKDTDQVTIHGRPEPK